MSQPDNSKGAIRLFGTCPSIPLAPIVLAQKPLIIPFPASMYGGQRCPEEINRLEFTIKVWQTIQEVKHSAPKVLCAGGLPNHNGLTLAKDMAYYLIEKCPGIEGSVIIGEQESTHTAQQIRWMRNLIHNEGFDVLVIISNWWHLRRINILFATHPIYYLDKEVILAASPTCGAIGRRFSRAIQEAIMCLLALTIDPQGFLFDSQTEKRRAQARQK